jgi:hypothetical protein
VVSFTPESGFDTPVPDTIVAQATSQEAQGDYTTQGAGGAGGGGGATLAWWSDWRTATGGSGNALYDGGKWTGSAWHINSTVLSASGLGFPAGMTNVLLAYMGNGDSGGDVSVCNGWALPTIGEAVAFRVYMRHGLTNLGGGLGSASNHPIQPGAGALPFFWAWKYGLASNGDITNLHLVHQESASPYKEFFISGSFPTDTMFIIEWSYERTASNVWKVRGKVSDGSYSEIDSFTDTGTVVWDSGWDNAQNLACGSSSAMRSLFIGWNGPGGWGNVRGTIHWGGAAVAITEPGEWIGPYPVGPEAL